MDASESMLGSLISFSVVLLLAGGAESPSTAPGDPVEPVEQEWLPPELRGITSAEQSRQAIAAKLTSSLGEPFPDWELRNKKGQRSLFSITPGSILLFYAGGPCPGSLEEVERLAALGWTSSEGRIVTILKNEFAYKQRDVRRALKNKPDVYYLASWDENGLMNYMRALPTFLVIDADRRLIAFRVGQGDDAIDSARASSAP